MKFQHHPDGLIYIKNNGAFACYPLAWFLTQEPAYSLPEGAIGREYIPEQRHSLYSANDQWGGEMLWEEGDRYLSNQAAYQDTWQADHPPTIPTPLPNPETLPKWENFREQILINPAYFRLAGYSPLTQTLNSSLVWLIGELGKNPDIFSGVTRIWNGIVDAAEPTEAEIESLNQIAINTQMPFHLNESGFMVPVSS